MHSKGRYKIKHKNTEIKFIFCKLILVIITLSIKSEMIILAFNKIKKTKIMNNNSRGF